MLVRVCAHHRGDAFSAAEFVMDYLKARATLWKKTDSAGREQWFDMKSSTAPLQSAGIKRMTSNESVGANCRRHPCGRTLNSHGWPFQGRSRRIPAIQCFSHAIVGTAIQRFSHPLAESAL
ncbi:MAG: molybdenum cofactor biosynthesis protein MoaE [Porticoccaceae bacterium]